ncbi:MAG: extracellular solute-binding protein [Actinobacteria bacterium]|nr:extracellular solute-binding protein [Actinomycetota bacterium]
MTRHLGGPMGGRDRIAGMSRREFMKRAAALGIGLPAAAAILEACSRPGQPAAGASPENLSGTGGIVVPGSPYPLARPTAPVTWKIYDDNPAIADDLPIEKDATLVIFNWSYYIWNKVIEDFASQYNVKTQYISFQNVSTGLAKLQTGKLQADVFFPTRDFVGKLVTAKLIQPLNHNYIPHLVSDNWPDFQNPFYDQQWRYTVPYTVYTTGVGYRRDVISDEEMATQGYDSQWNPKYKGKVGVLDDYREVLGMALLRRGITDVNTTDPKLIAQAGDDLAKTIDLVDVRVDNNAWTGIPKGQYVVHQDWCGGMVAAWENSPKQTMSEYEKIGYWYPKDRVGAIQNDLMVIPKSAPHPVLAHKFLDFLLTYENAMTNFSWNLYQPPQIKADPETLTTTSGAYGARYGMPYVPPWMPDAVVRQADFQAGVHELELAPDVNQLWQDAYNKFQAGA